MASAHAVVLLSGGLDSAITLAIARSEGFVCHALSVNYGQRHGAELDAARRVASVLGAHEHRIMRIDLAGIGGSALTDPSIPVPDAPTDGIPVTYVPARNTALLALALGWAEVLKSRDIYIGVNAIDYSVAGHTRIWLRGPGGARLLRIDDACSLPAGDYETIAVDPTTLESAWRRVTGRCKHEVRGKRCFRVRLERGQVIEVTEDHSLFTIDERTGRLVAVAGSAIHVGMPLVVPFDLSAQARAWSKDLVTIDLRTRDVLASESTKQSSVVVDGMHLTNRLRRTHVPLDFPLCDDFLRIVGLWLAEGGKDPTSSGTNLSFSIGALPGGADLLRRYFGRFCVKLNKSPANEFDYRVDSSVLYEVFRRLDLFGTSRSGDKRFPPWFWDLSQRQRRVVVAGLWDGDGGQVWRGEAPISQKSHAVIDDLYHCLLLDGIFPTVKLVAHGQKRLALTRSRDFTKFVELYPLLHPMKRESFVTAAKIKGRDKTTGLWKGAWLWEQVAAAELAAGAKTRIYNTGGKYDISVRAQRTAFETVPSLRELCACKLAFLRVVAVEQVEHEHMYDLSVEGAENFIANGILAHNSGYPDCRPEFVAAFENLAAVATRAGVEGHPTRIHAPLIQLTKADIILRGIEHGVDFSITVSCYRADSHGRACGRCDSCRLRREGFKAVGIADPTRYQ